MKQQTVLTIAISLTAFIMLAVGGVIIAEQTAQAKSSIQAQVQTAQTDQMAQNADVQQAPQVSQDLLKQIADREAQYQALINQANAQLEQAQKDEKAIQDQLAALKSTNAQLAAQVAAQPAILTPVQASQVAADYMHEKDLYAVELVKYYTSTAYKVTFSSGAIVFVSTYGQIMAALSAPSADVSSGGGGGGGRGSKATHDDGGGHDD
jgi:septal ring factor EnvC (AmiA/AmiB activator)